MSLVRLCFALYLGFAYISAVSSLTHVHTHTRFAFASCLAYTFMTTPRTLPYTRLCLHFGFVFASQFCSCPRLLYTCSLHHRITCPCTSTSDLRGPLPLKVSNFGSGCMARPIAEPKPSLPNAAHASDRRVSSRPSTTALPNHHLPRKNITSHVHPFQDVLRALCAVQGEDGQLL